MAYNNFYELVKEFPSTERYDLSSQLIRAARSIPANLAEGHGRQTVKDELRFCIMARGSWTECLNHLIDAKDCGLLSFENLGELKGDWDKLGRLLNGYINFQRSQLSKTISKTESGEAKVDIAGQNITEPQPDYRSMMIDSDILQEIDNRTFIELLKS